MWAAVLFAALIVGCLCLYGYTFEGLVLDESGVTVTLFSRVRATVPWSEIKEVGVLYHNLRPRARRSPSGCSIYLSREAMTDAQRTQTVRTWRPRGMLSLGFTPERLQAVRQFWQGDVVLFLISKRELFPDGMLPSDSHKLVEHVRE